jgi:hypothetical protein
VIESGRTQGSAAGAATKFQLKRVSDADSICSVPETGVEKFGEHGGAELRG